MDGIGEVGEEWKVVNKGRLGNEGISDERELPAKSRKTNDNNTASKNSSTQLCSNSSTTSKDLTEAMGRNARFHPTQHTFHISHTSHLSDSSHTRRPPPINAPMRTCSCYGTPPSDPNYWPYSIKVCEACISDDVEIGRIRYCGICGVVACDEYCGVKLVECTDEEEWNNKGGSAWGPNW